MQSETQNQVGPLSLTPWIFTPTRSSLCPTSWTLAPSWKGLASGPGSGLGNHGIKLTLGQGEPSRGFDLWSNGTQKALPFDFPGGLVVKNPPSDAEDMGSIPAWGTKIPCATWQLSLHATTRALACRNENPAQPKKKVHFLHPKERQPYSGDRELQPGSLLLHFLFTTPNPNSV